MKRVLSLLSIAAGAGFIIGCWKSFPPVLAHRYLHYKILRLVALGIYQGATKWTLLSLATAVLLLLLLKGCFLMVRWILSRPVLSYVVNSNLSGMNRPIDRRLFKFLDKWLLNCWVRGLGLVIVGLLIFLNAFIYFGRVKSSAGMNFILIISDCLRPDHLGCYGYERTTSPVIDKIAGNGVICRNSYANAPWTKPSLASIFTGLYPNVHQAVDNDDTLPDEVLTLAEVLKNEGYFTYFLHGENTFLNKEFNLDQGFDVNLSPRINNAAGLVDKFLSDILRRGDRKFFACLHFMDTHLPYGRNRYNNLFADRKSGEVNPGRILYRELQKLDSQGHLSDGDKNYLIDFYDGQIRYVDENIGRMIDRLEENNLLENTIIILTADHGEELWERNNYNHGHTLYNELLRVPLIIFGDQFTPAEITKPVRLIDLFSTIIELARINPKELKQNGNSLIKIIEQEGEAEEYRIFITGTYYGDEKYCLIQNNQKIIRNTGSEEGKENIPGGESRERWEFYDLKSDPEEKNNLAATHPKLVAGLKKELKALGYLQ